MAIEISWSSKQITKRAKGVAGGNKLNHLVRFFFCSFPIFACIFKIYFLSKVIIFHVNFHLNIYFQFNFSFISIKIIHTSFFVIINILNHLQPCQLNSWRGQECWVSPNKAILYMDIFHCLRWRLSASSINTRYT